MLSHRISATNDGVRRLTAGGGPPFVVNFVGVCTSAWVINSSPNIGEAQALHRVLRRRSPMRGAIHPSLTRVRQGGDVPPIGLNAPAAVAIHRREIGIGHDHLVSERLQVLRNPLTLGRRLEQNAHARPSPKHRRQAIARRRDPSVDDLTALP